MENFIAVIGQDISNLPVSSFDEGDEQPGRFGAFPFNLYLNPPISRPLSGLTRQKKLPILRPETRTNLHTISPPDSPFGREKMAPWLWVVCQKEKAGRSGIETAQRSDPSKGAVAPGCSPKEIPDNRTALRVGESYQNAPRLIKAKEKGRGRDQQDPIEKEGREPAPLSGASGRGRRNRTLRAERFASERQTSLRHPFQNLSPGSQSGFRQPPVWRMRNQIITINDFLKKPSGICDDSHRMRK